jgi:hypothetical protein
MFQKLSLSRHCFLGLEQQVRHYRLEKKRLEYFQNLLPLRFHLHRLQNHQNQQR